ncbi:MAG: DoxX family protein [Verrucomicrobiales bacterium]|nr:DoxX family protein [Verrucomicrobiales bacterium]
MEIAVTVVQILIALAIFNIWILRFNKSTPFRGGGAKNMKEEFEAYGLPVWFMLTIGGLKLILATALIAGLWFPEVTRPAAAGMAFLMMGAVVMHLKVKDPLKRSLPALAMLGLSLFVALFATQ